MDRKPFVTNHPMMHTLESSRPLSGRSISPSLIALAAANFVLAALKLAVSFIPGECFMLGECFPLVNYRLWRWVTCGAYLLISAAILMVVAIAKIDDTKRSQATYGVLLLLYWGLSKFFEGEILWHVYMVGRLQWHVSAIVWELIPLVELSAIFFLCVGSAFALKVLFFSTSGGYLTQFVEYIRLIIRKQHRWLLIVHSCFCIFIAILSIVLVSNWTNVIDGSLRLSAWVFSTFSTFLILWIHIRPLQSHIAADDLEAGRQYLTENNLTGKDDVASLWGEFDYDLYTIIRLYDLEPFEDEPILEKLDTLGNNAEIIAILELPDESWELSVLKIYVPKLENLLNRVFLNYSLDQEHRPFDPSTEAVKNFVAKHPQWSETEDEKRVYLAAKAQMVDEFSRRADTMIRTGWPRAVIFYSHLLKHVGKADKKADEKVWNAEDKKGDGIADVGKVMEGEKSQKKFPVPAETVDCGARLAHYEL